MSSTDRIDHSVLCNSIRVLKEILKSKFKHLRDSCEESYGQKKIVVQRTETIEFQGDSITIVYSIDSEPYISVRHSDHIEGYCEVYLLGENNQGDCFKILVAERLKEIGVESSLFF